MTVSYHYFGNRTLDRTRARNASADRRPSASRSRASVEPLDDPTNPVFNFDRDFVNNMQLVTVADIAQSVPYISLSSLKPDGTVLDDFNMKFFHRGIDMSAVSSQARYSDRPDLSLKDLKIRSDMAAGFTYFTIVSMTLKLHRPDTLANSTLISLMFPGMPMKLVYGWNNTGNTPGARFLNDSKEVLFFALNEYFITFDASGQADLRIEGISFNENLNNILVGDIGTRIQVSDMKGRSREGKELLSDSQIRGLVATKDQIDAYVAHLEEVRQRPDGGGTRNLELIKNMTVAFTNMQKRASVDIQTRFKQFWDRLARVKQPASNFPGISRGLAGRITRDGSFVTVHDILSILCGETLNALEGVVLPAGKNFRFVYGALNENVGRLSGLTIADFPIHWNRLVSILNEEKANGLPVPTLQKIFNIIIDEFIRNEEYWRSYLSPGTQDLNIPFVILQITTHVIGASEVIQVSLIDVHRDVPITTKQIRSLNRSTASQQEVEAAVLGDSPAMPILRLGHANSFIKNINVAHYDDASLRSAFIARASQNRVGNPRIPISPDAAVLAQSDNALFLPLKGDMDVLGHTAWKPGRFFYLSSGIFFLDAVYKILGFEHEISMEGFKTKVFFGYH